ncbi:MAG: N-acetylneuraminate synthase family protein [Deltaproteobacteria bacterium]|nr:N-acetylneuraminate synthase family protein [Deltaproteobacteria bacterium]
MIIGGHNTDDEVLIVAEIGNNHEGNFDLAQELIGMAAECGVHAVKFQTFRTEQYISRTEEQRFQRTKSFELIFEQFAKLADYSKEKGVIFFSTPFDLESARFLESIQSVFKISSGDNNFYPLIKQVAESGKAIIMSGGLADITQLQYAKALIELTWHQKGTKQELALLHCITSYPTAPNEANLAAITHFKEHFNCTVGYSDHTLGIEACVLAAALGARIIEKHFTLDKNYSEFRDHKLSAEPQEMKQLVERVKEAGVYIGKAGRTVQQGEKSIATSMRRAIAAKRDLEKGHRIELEDITWVRPANGLAPGEEHSLVGKVLNRSVNWGEPITLEMVQDRAP